MSRQPLRRLLLATTALAPLGLLPAAANPQGPQVVGGAAALSGVGTSAVTVTQTTDKAIINWQTFNIGANESTRFVQPGSSSIALNRVTGGFGASLIDGSLTANGRVFIVNPDGILIGRGAVIDTGGFLATTHDINNADFMAGRYNFGISGNPSASIVNQGTITASSGGFAALVAPGVRNTGTITATLGTVSLASGNGFSLDFYGDKLITLGVNDSIAATVKDVSTGQPLQSLISNEGKLKANGGRVELTAAASRKVVDSVINNSGVIEARSIGTRNGMIVLGAATVASKPAGAPAQTVRLSGKLSVAGRKAGATGGVIQVTGENIWLTGAKLDASGRAGGGTVLIGGDVGGGNPNPAVASILQARSQSYWVPTATNVSIDATSTINASAKSAGSGGKVVVWADGVTNFYGTILARASAGSGDGGFVEVSGKTRLDYNGFSDLSAASGTFGTLLLDPYNVTISNGTNNTGGSFVANTNDSIINAGTLQTALGSASIIVTTGSGGSQTGDIRVISNVTWAANTTLTLNAYRNIEVGASATISNTGAGSLVLRADGTGTGTGTVMLSAGTFANRVDWSGSTGKIDIFYNPTNYLLPTDFLAGNGRVVGNGSISNQVTAYMLVNSILNFSSMVPAGTYALGRDIDASLAGVLPGLGVFTGVFDGQGHTLSNVTINGSGALAVNSGTIRNLTLSGFNIVAGPSDSNAGILVGANIGTISHVTVNNSSIQAGYNGQAIGGIAGTNTGLILDTTIWGGSVSGGAFQNITAGGVAGSNMGAIFNSYAFSAVTVGSGSVAGGLAGTSGGTIQDSGALGPVLGGGNSALGGLVGASDLNSVIAGSFAAGPVTSTGPNSWLGGLVGLNAGVVSSSLASGPVQGTQDSVLGGLVGLNVGYVNLSFTDVTSTVTGGSGSVVGGLVGVNFGSVVLSDAHGAVAGGESSVVGGLVGANAAFDNIPSGLLPLSSFPEGTINGSAAYGTATGLANSTVGPLVGINGPKTLPAAPSVLSQCTDSLCGVLQTGHLKTPAAIGDQDNLPDDVFATALLVHLVTTTDPVQQQEALGVLIALTQPAGPPPDSPAGGSGPGAGTPPPGAAAVGPGALAPPPPLRTVAGPDGERFSSIPPIGETRFATNEVVVQVGANIPAAQITALAQQLGLTVITSENLGSTNRTAFRFRIANGRSVRDIIRALEANRITAIAQPNYRYRLSQTADTPATGGQGDPAQYMMSKLQLQEVHRSVSGKGIIVALVDSEVDRKHTELTGAISEEFDAVGAGNKAHPHGTAMAGAISSRDRLMGVAPGARILAVRAFSESQATAEGTTYSIIKGIDWAVSQGARVINMSFAGPNDPSLQRALKSAHDKGVVLIAAAGNAGPKSPALYPAADPSVIAVTATDSDDKLFKMANRGNYVSIAAPGVEILAPAPDEAYQFSTGTSIATAHISGVVAMMLERDPSLTPAEVRSILETTALDLGPKGRDAQFGWGLVSPQRALAAVDARKIKPVASPAAR